jgi:hypothetical protein
MLCSDRSRACPGLRRGLGSRRERDTAPEELLSGHNSESTTMGSPAPPCRMQGSTDPVVHLEPTPAIPNALINKPNRYVAVGHVSSQAHDS